MLSSDPYLDQKLKKKAQVYQTIKCRGSTIKKG